MGESFGGCLALRVAAAAPEVVARLVLVNPATCFGQSLFGVSSLVAATNLLSVFPKPLYEVRMSEDVRSESNGPGHSDSPSVAPPCRPVVLSSPGRLDH